MSITYKEIAETYFTLSDLHRRASKASPLYSQRRSDHLRLAELFDVQGVAWAQLDPTSKQWLAEVKRYA